MFQKKNKSSLPQENPFIGLFTLKYIIEIKAKHLKNGFKFKVYIYRLILPKVTISIHVKFSKNSPFDR